MRTPDENSMIFLEMLDSVYVWSLKQGENLSFYDYRDKIIKSWSSGKYAKCYRNNLGYYEMLNKVFERWVGLGFALPPDHERWFENPASHYNQLFC